MINRLMAEIVIAKYLDVREIHILKMNDLQKEKSFCSIPTAYVHCPSKRGRTPSAEWMWEMIQHFLPTLKCS